MALTWPAGVKWLNGTYSGTATKNIIQLISTKVLCCNGNLTKNK